MSEGLQPCKPLRLIQSQGAEWSDVVTAMAIPSLFHSYVQTLVSAESSDDVVGKDDMGSAELLPHTGLVFLTGAVGSQKLVHRITHEILHLPGYTWLGSK